MWSTSSPSTILSGFPIYLELWLKSQFIQRQILLEQPSQRALLLIAVIQNIFCTEKMWIWASWSTWWFMVRATNCFCHKTKIRGPEKAWKMPRTIFHYIYFIKYIKTMSVVQELIEAFYFICTATLSISSTFFDSTYFAINRKWHFFSQSAESKHQVFMWLCWQHALILKLTWPSLSQNPDLTVSSRSSRVVKELVAQAWCPMACAVCHQWSGIRVI